MRVAVIIVNYGQWGLTEKCIDSVLGSTGAEVTLTLVDNHSPGEVPAWAGSRSDIRFCRMEENTGFAGGNNRGFQLALEDGADYTFFLNNDAEVTPSTISDLAGFLDGTPEAGISAPVIYYASEPGRVWSAGGRFIPWKMRFDQKLYPTADDLPSESVNMDFCSGCAMMVRTDLFQQLGGFREDFFMYYEDGDLCHRVAGKGFSIWLLPKVSVFHHVAAGSGGELSPLAVYFSERNRIILSRDMLSIPVRMVFYAYITAVLLVKTLKFLLWQGPGLVRWIWSGFLSGFAGRTGYRKVMARLSRQRSLQRSGSSGSR